ncbi:hypothetical protein ADUPG1_008404 [Aduncisulcus paluster]|uniref:Uncharacterized protein n=1 Tax=Aduncisulcus paluster TaxID=2918883 RepID=A0ABQ5KRU3_9EUKA|nr:hypothetical protein ADUPG1_008404 [Aduncisulcus paluster]
MPVTVSKSHFKPILYPEIQKQLEKSPNSHSSTKIRKKQSKYTSIASSLYPKTLFPAISSVLSSSKTKTSHSSLRKSIQRKSVPKKSKSIVLRRSKSALSYNEHCRSHNNLRKKQIDSRQIQENGSLDSKAKYQSFAIPMSVLKSPSSSSSYPISSVEQQLSGTTGISIVSQNSKNRLSKRSLLRDKKTEDEKEKTPTTRDGTKRSVSAPIMKRKRERKREREREGKKDVLFDDIRCLSIDNVGNIDHIFLEEDDVGEEVQEGAAIIHVHEKGEEQKEEEPNTNLSPDHQTIISLETIQRERESSTPSLTILATNQSHDHSVIRTLSMTPVVSQSSINITKETTEKEKEEKVTSQQTSILEPPDRISSQIIDNEEQNDIISASKTSKISEEIEQPSTIPKEIDKKSETFEGWSDYFNSIDSTKSIVIKSKRSEEETLGKEGIIRQPPFLPAESSTTTAIRSNALQTKDLSDDSARIHRYTSFIDGFIDKHAREMSISDSTSSPDPHLSGSNYADKYDDFLGDDAYHYPSPLTLLSRTPRSSRRSQHGTPNQPSKQFIYGSSSLVVSTERDELYKHEDIRDMCMKCKNVTPQKGMISLPRCSVGAHDKIMCEKEEMERKRRRERREREKLFMKERKRKGREKTTKVYPMLDDYFESTSISKTPEGRSKNRTMRKKRKVVGRLGKEKKSGTLKSHHHANSYSTLSSSVEQFLLSTPIDQREERKERKEERKERKEAKRREKREDVIDTMISTFSSSLTLDSSIHFSSPIREVHRLQLNDSFNSSQNQHRDTSSFIGECVSSMLGEISDLKKDISILKRKEKATEVL